MSNILNSPIKMVTLSAATAAVATATIVGVAINNNNNKPEENIIKDNIAIKCTMYDYISDDEIYKGVPGRTYHELNYEVFKAKGYDNLEKTNTLTALPLGSFINDKPDGYDSDMDTLLNESFGNNYKKLNEDIYETYSTVASFNSGVSLNTATQGLVDNTLTNGTITQSYNGKKDYVPWFDDEFLNTKIPGWDITYGSVYDNLEFPFRYNETSGYYEFDSKVDTVVYDEYAKKLDYKGMNTEQVNDAWGAGFYPYNSPNDNAYNYGFGVKMEVPFTLSEDRLHNGEPIIFEFKGDDDVWVFIDGYLALDLGGNHTGTKGTLNITEQRSIVENTINKNLVTARGPFFIPSATKVYSLEEMEQLGIKGVNSSQQGIINNEVTAFPQELIDSLASGKTHTLTLFYMERAKGTSNLNVKFNLPVIDEEIVEEEIEAISTPIPTPEPAKKTNIKVTNGEKIDISENLKIGNKKIDCYYCFYMYDNEKEIIHEAEDIEFVIENEGYETTSFILSNSSDINDRSAYIPKSDYEIYSEDNKVLDYVPIGYIFAKDHKQYKDMTVSDYVKKYEDKKFYNLEANKKYKIDLKNNYLKNEFQSGETTLWLHGNVFTTQDVAKVRIVKRSLHVLH